LEKNIFPYRQDAEEAERIIYVQPPERQDFGLPPIIARRASWPKLKSLKNFSSPGLFSRWRWNYIVLIRKRPFRMESIYFRS
jgi:hypothetical protein